jgi:hypothetical protein
MRVEFGLVSFLDVLNHQGVILESLDLLLLGLEVACELLEFGELDDFAIKEFGLEFGVVLAVLYFCNFIEMGLVFHFTLLIE